jgi:hypothetical protein
MPPALLMRIGSLRTGLEDIDAATKNIG